MFTIGGGCLLRNIYRSPFLHQSVIRLSIHHFIRQKHLLRQIAGNDRLLKSIEDRCQPDVVGKVHQLIEEYLELQDLKEDRELGKEAVKDIESLTREFTHLEPLIINGLARNEDFFVDTVLLQVSCGVGGQEAMLFAAELIHVYEQYCLSKGWTFSSIKYDESDLGGIRSASIQIKGQQCFFHLRHEAGVHRVQRIPKTEKSGRIHTSTVAVHVIPVREGVSIVIEDNDLEFSTKRSSSKGGQHVNKTESCAIIKHLPTGITVECQEERQLHVNKERALKKLEQLLMLREKERIIDEYEKTKSYQVRNKSRSEKVRTYNFPQDRITDHRLKENVHDIKSFMDGSPQKLDGIIQQLNEEASKELLESFLNST